MNGKAVFGSLLVGLLLFASAGRALAQSADESIDALLREGGNVLLIRHAATVSGVGDPPGFRLDDCSTQRNLSDRGRADARRLGERLKASGGSFAHVRSSAWCRCTDTARLAFLAEPEVWQPLNSFFAGQGNQSTQTAVALGEARRVPAGENWVWVTHQVNISALTGTSVAMGEVLIARWNGSRLEIQARFSP